MYHRGTILASGLCLLSIPDGGLCLSFHSNQRHTIAVSPSVASSVTSRREVFNALLGGASAAVLLSNPSPSIAAPVPTQAELKKLQLGYGRIQFLLANWDDLTSSCGTKIMSDNERKQVMRTEGGGGGSCDKTPLRVQEYLGYKSTEDPLYRADKLLVRAASLVNPDNIEDYLDVIERYRDKSDNVAMMAFTSAWGEANPNGGKEVIDDYLERTKVDVESAEKLLKSALGYLNLEILPMPTGKR